MVFRITGGPKKLNVDQLPGTTPKTTWKTLGVAAVSALIRKLAITVAVGCKTSHLSHNQEAATAGPTQDLVTFDTVCKRTLYILLIYI